MAFQKILVATDYSEVAQRALRVAGALAAKIGAEVRVLNVIDPRGVNMSFRELATYVNVGEMLDAMRKAAASEMPKVVAAAHVPSGVMVSTEIVEGIPAEEIIEAAKRFGADVIVCGTHGRSGFSRLFFGSVAAKLVRMAHRPVLTVGPLEAGTETETETEAGPKPAGGPAR